MSQQQTRLVVVLIALFSLSQPYDCASYQQIMQHGIQRSRQPVDEGNLIRVMLTRNQEQDSLKVIKKNNFYETKPLKLNSQLVGFVQIGNPKQEFKFIFDTDHSILWVSSSNCGNCDNKKSYNSSASTTYVKDGKNITTNGNHGFRSIDQVSFGDVVIKNQTFAEVSQLSPSSVAAPYDGSFCLGIDRAVIRKVPTPLRQMVNQGLIKREVFSIYQNSTGGEIVFGGVDRNQYTGLITWALIIDEDAWAFRMDSLTLKENVNSGLVGETVCENGCDVYISTYLSYILGPADEVMIINEAMGGEVDEDDDSIFVLPDCDLSKLSNLVFKIADREFELTPEQYIQKVYRKGETICVSLLHVFLPASVSGGEWYIGSSVVGHIYTVFDYENRRIGFANAK